MKTILPILFLTVCLPAFGADKPAPQLGGKKANEQIKQAPPPPRAARAPAAPAPKADYLAGISVSPYMAIIHDGIGDGETYGAGLALTVPINKFVGLELAMTTHSENDWRDEAIDETSVLGRVELAKSANKALSLYALAGIDRDWGMDDWALGVGGGVQLRFHKNAALFADSRLRAWMSDECEKTKDIATRLGITITY